MRLNEMLQKLQHAGRRVGIDAKPWRPLGPRRQRLMAERGIATVLDVGGHYGEYASELRANGYSGQIISFEPVQAHLSRLREAAAADPRWSVEPVAASDVDGSAELTVAGVLSSLLPPDEALHDALPGSRSNSTEEVRLAQLDGLEQVRAQITPPTMLKIDVQGNELNVLTGAAEVVGDASMIELELTVTPLYTGQPLMVEMLRYLDDRGFSLLELESEFRDHRTGHHYQYNGILSRDDSGGAA